MITADMKVTGRFDDAYAIGARPLIERLAAEFRDITVDMSDVIDMDAAGLGALVALHKRLNPLGYCVRVLGANDKLLRVFERFQLADLFIDGAAIPTHNFLRTCFFGIGAGASAVARQAVKRAELEVAREDADARSIAGNVVPLDAARNSVKAWLDSATLAGGRLRGGDALKSYKRWAGQAAKDFKAADLRRSLAGILGAERVRSSTSGYVVQGIQLRRAIASRARTAA